MWTNKISGPRNYSGTEMTGPTHSLGVPKAFWERNEGPQSGIAFPECFCCSQGQGQSFHSEGCWFSPRAGYLATETIMENSLWIFATFNVLHRAQRSSQLEKKPLKRRETKQAEKFSSPVFCFLHSGAAWALKGEDRWGRGRRGLRVWLKSWAGHFKPAGKKEIQINQTQSNFQLVQL